MASEQRTILQTQRLRPKKQGSKTTGNRKSMTLLAMKLSMSAIGYWSARDNHLGQLFVIERQRGINNYKRDGMNKVQRPV
jgi:hypothetical protein